MNLGSNTERYPAFAHIGKNLNQVTCPDRESNPGHLVSRLDALTWGNLSPICRLINSYLTLSLTAVILVTEAEEEEGVEKKSKFFFQYYYNHYYYCSCHRYYYHRLLPQITAITNKNYHHYHY
ncbi:hypothetical protein ANN_19923 [Periplaneta americana]|uniref:Uncharacterized protein n=1 Tax=Periplaneta americana TaxID=6978 RepID=A0ABQ8SBW0_PERAM|nr:hypothetical protein ANN_19923 [Periplaneta americana]